LFTLTYRIGGNESDLNACALNIFGDLSIPPCNIVENSRSIRSTSDILHLFALRGSHQVFAHERWVAEDVTAFFGR
jgi:hypothetical protein